MTVPQVSPAELKAYHEKVIEEFRANGGKLGGQFAGQSLLLLTTTGAKTGKPRTAPLTYTKDFSRFVIIAAKRGAPTNPDWYHNLIANPNVTVEVGDETFRAVARVAEGEERQRLFDQMTSQRPNFTEFQSKTTRQLPVIVLERVLDTQTDYNAFNRGFIEEFRARGGKVGGIFEGLPVLLLTTIGAKSGQPRIAPLVYVPDGDQLLIIASKGGSPTNPDWVHNLLANPVVTVDLGTESFPARATIAEGPARPRLFEKIVARIPYFAEAQRKAPREFPIFVLERTDGDP